MTIVLKKSLETGPSGLEELVGTRVIAGLVQDTVDDVYGVVAAWGVSTQGDFYLFAGVLQEMVPSPGLVQVTDELILEPGWEGSSTGGNLDSVNGCTLVGVPSTACDTMLNP